jgi:glycosyltransferase involved in cell wall biosynthesis
VLPTYNHAHYISQALDSVLAQSILPEQIIVLDDASTDHTAAVVDRYNGLHPRLEYVRFEKNGGVIHAMKVGLAKVEVDFVVFLAADDTLDSSALEKCLNVMRQHSRSAVCGLFARYIDESGRRMKTPPQFDFGSHARYVEPGECLKRLMRDGALFGGNGAMYRARRLKEIGGFASELGSFCDGYAVQQLALSDGVCIVPEELASWRQRATSYAASSRANPKAILGIIDAIEKRADRQHLPFAYTDRLLKRMHFQAVEAALRSKPLDAAILRMALPESGRSCANFLARLASLTGRPSAIALTALMLRPFDIGGALMRRLRKKFDRSR